MNTAADRERPILSGRKSRQQRAIAALLAGSSLTKASAHVGISERTLRRWLADDADFQDTYRTAARALFDAATNRLRAAASEAVTVLFDALRDTSATVRLRAALGILDAATKSDLDDLARRIERLEGRRTDNHFQ